MVPLLPGHDLLKSIAMVPSHPISCLTSGSGGGGGGEGGAGGGKSGGECGAGEGAGAAGGFGGAMSQSSKMFRSADSNRKPFFIDAGMGRADSPATMLACVLESDSSSSGMSFLPAAVQDGWG